MIDLKKKENCTGCKACGDVCPKDAITFRTDKEGFWYPEIDRSKCVDCHLCEKVCPELNLKRLRQTGTFKPEYYALLNKDLSVRLDSTSGGAFSLLANQTFQAGGYVGGAVYTEDFHVRHFLTDNPEDLKRLRSSKYLQSDTAGFYRQVKDLLLQGKKVLVCGSPCQMSALQLYLDAVDATNLIVCDYICKGINSPKVFRKHLDSLERKYGSKITYVKAKNKELGWRELTFKATFENGKSYYGTGTVDNFTRGYLRSGIFCRPSCYTCDFKSAHHRADITLGDFWGLEMVAPELDDDKGASLLICNTEKGQELFNSVKEQCLWKKVLFSEVLERNHHLLHSLKHPDVSRDAFFKDVDDLPFEQVAEKYFPITWKDKIPQRIRNRISAIINLLVYMWHAMGCNPLIWIQFLKLNFFTKEVHSDILRGKFILPYSHCVWDIAKGAEIHVNGILFVGVKKFRKSRMETRILVGKDAVFNIDDDFAVWAGADIQIFPGGQLILRGGKGAGCNINCQIVCAKKISIGRRCLIGRNVVIRDYDAHTIHLKGYKIASAIKIGDYCWIGDGAMISKGVTMGDGAIAGARSFVVSKIPPRTLFLGNPAVQVEENIDWSH